MKITKHVLNGISVIRLANKFLEMEVAPEIGGRILSLRDIRTGYQFLWNNPNLKIEKLPVGSEYDPNFYGGIDELLPNDMPQEINDVLCPDHGELWTQALRYTIQPDGILMEGELPISGLTYRREISICPGRPQIIFNYNIGNPTDKRKEFLWKIHAAMRLKPGDEILCPAQTAVVADSYWSRWSERTPFAWPMIEGQHADLIPIVDGSTDFLYLYDLKEGMMGWKRSSENLAFVYRFDPTVIPYCWYFASYGGFHGHYTGVLEPCTTMPCSVTAAAKLGQCSVLEPGQVLETTVSIYAGTLDVLDLGKLEG